MNYSKPAVPMFLPSCRKFICCECGSGRLNLAAARGSTCGNVLSSDYVRFTEYHQHSVCTFRSEWKTGCCQESLSPSPFVCPDYQHAGGDSRVKLFMNSPLLVPAADEFHLPVACYAKMLVSRLPHYAKKGVPLHKFALKASLEYRTEPWYDNLVLFMDNELTLVWSIEKNMLERLAANPDSVSESYLQCYRHYQASPKGAGCQPTLGFGLLAYQVQLSGKPAVAPNLKYFAVHHEGYIYFHNMRSGAEVSVESRSSRKVNVKQGRYVDMFFGNDWSLCVKDLANRVFVVDVPRDIRTTREELKILVVDQQRLFPLDVFDLLSSSQWSGGSGDLADFLSHASVDLHLRVV